MKRRVIGYLLILLSVVLTLSNKPNITGAAIGSNFSNSINFLAAVLFVFGLLLTTYSSSRESTQALEERVEVYDDGKDSGGANRKQKHYLMIDSRGDFGKPGGIVSLERVRDKINNSDFEEVEIIKGDYGSGLKRIILKGGEKQDIAREFLMAIDRDYVPEESNYNGLSKDERREIQLGFRNFDGNPRSIPKKLIEKYDLILEKTGGRHLNIRQNGYKGKVVAPISPSDWRGGRNLGSEVVRLVESNRKKSKK